MPLLDQGRVVEDAWIRVTDDAPLPDGPAILSLERWRMDSGRLGNQPYPLGVLLESDQGAALIAEDLPRLALVAVAFPKFRDGRGFTTARTLRERYGFTGEVRAVGHILPDQYRHLLRCGFDRVETPPGSPPASWEAALGLVDIAYQPGQGEDQALSLLRRRLIMQK
ncbi:DUF934 domain-containing protein [Oceanibaculum pacificum]|uniref:Oxidoreductase n=1 Tax=Oceanibaculum pacificum TaxID=580166 RepID=A0A154W1S0_9PROT|nr:DUF934 domain-containing protein [Oceanibaculum pacificum]KZD07407.1 hypothetical protein AUP43_02485 [Oceanibaculum pacificum]